MKNSRTSQYLDSLNINKMRFGLGAITSVLSRLGHPQKSFKAVTITGTNGKGSTAAMIAAMLHKAGYCVGLYTSPHLIDVRERITVNGRKISRKDFDRIIVCVRKKVVQPLTYFEFITAVAFEYFKTRKADIAVLEVGLGGRLDATNVCRPLVSVITNIAFDHTAYLGRTLTSIAVEKAGIIKPHGLCVTGVAQKKILGLLQDICLQRGASLYRLNHDFRLARQKNGSLLYEGVYSDVKNLTVPLRGEHQLANAALALAAVETCARKGFPVSETAVRAGLQNVRWEGRLEVLHISPWVLLDGAHNPAGIGALCRSLKKDFSFRHLILIFGVLADKDYRKMLQKIVPLARVIILAPLKAQRAASVAAVSQTIRSLGRMPVVSQSVHQALELGLSLAGSRDLICATGSFYLAGEVKQTFSKLVFCDNEKSKKVQGKKVS